MNDDDTPNVKYLHMEDIFRANALDPNDPDYFEKVRDTLGINDGDKIVMVEPPLDRTDGITVTYTPKTVDEYLSLKHRRPDELLAMGCCVFLRDGKRLHWLFPHEWYPHIPAGLEVRDLLGTPFKFVPGETSDDRRLGLLAFGFCQSTDDWTDTIN